MDELTWVTCHRCGREFTTRASTRTTCTCRAAVTVRRDGESRTDASDSDYELPMGMATLVGVLIFVGIWIFRAWGGSGAGDSSE
jgi:hypothetical protein